jgi:hypothetical protein
MASIWFWSRENQIDIDLGHFPYFPASGTDSDGKTGMSLVLSRMRIDNTGIKRGCYEFIQAEADN